MIYLISYTPYFLYPQPTVHDFVTNHLNGSDWWYYTNIYLLDTTLTIPQITSSFRSRFPGMMHFVAKVDLNNNGGVLPQEAWDWINKKIQIPVKLNTLPPLSPLNLILKKASTPPAQSYNPKAVKSVYELIRNSKKK